MAEKPNIPDFPDVPDFRQMITQACEVIANIRGIPYDFNGTLSLENKFVVLFKTVKAMFDAQATLADSYKDLYDFVKNYFDNLDVQEEINAKIDAMIADGTFYNLFTDVIPYVMPEMFGAVGNGLTDDTESFKKALDHGGFLWLSEKTYLISETLYINVNKTSLHGCSSRSVLKVSDNFTGDSALVFYSKNGDYYTRLTRENQHGNFRIDAKGKVALRVGGERNTDYEGSVECQTFNNIMCVSASTAVVIGAHSYRNEYRQIDTYECNYSIRTPDPYDINEVNTFYNCGFWSGSVNLTVPTSFFGCTFHLTMQTDSKNGYKFAHRFANGNYNLIACHFEYLTPEENKGVAAVIDSGLVAVDASVYIEGAEMVFTPNNNTLTVSNYLFYCIDTSDGHSTSFTLNHCNTKYLFNRIILGNHALANWGLYSYGGEYQNSWQDVDTAKYTYNATLVKNLSDEFTGLTKLGTSSTIDYKYNREAHTLTCMNNVTSQQITIGKTVRVGNAQSIHLRIKASSNDEPCKATVNLDSNTGLIFLDGNGNTLNANAKAINNNWSYATDQNLDMSIWLAIPATCETIIYGIGIIGSSTTNTVITIDECYAELV